MENCVSSGADGESFSDTSMSTFTLSRCSFCANDSLIVILRLFLNGVFGSKRFLITFSKDALNFSCKAPPTKFFKSIVFTILYLLLIFLREPHNNLANILFLLNYEIDYCFFSVLLSFRCLRMYLQGLLLYCSHSSTNQN